MQTWQILAICAAILVIAAIGWYVYEQSRSRHLRRRFGTEYDRAVTDIGDRRRAESELARRENRINKLRIRALSVEDRMRFTDRWRLVQAQFVDDPAGAVERIAVVLVRQDFALRFELRDVLLQPALHHEQRVDHGRLGLLRASRSHRRALSESVALGP